MTEVQHIKCKACGSSGPHKAHAVREMMFGTRQAFNYLECANCGSLQRIDTVDLGPFYPAQYYSVAHVANGRLGEWLRLTRDRHLIGNRSLLGLLLAKAWPNPVISRLASLGFQPTSRVLEVGCGDGWFIKKLSRWGLKGLVGIDPYTSNEGISEKFSIYRKTLKETNGQFDFIIFNHSLEHISDPIEELKIARALLTGGGICFIRLPTTSSAAWAEYRENWVQIDAPRHALIPSRSGMTEIARQSGFKILHSHDDSTESQFIGSELYRRDIPLNESYRHTFNPSELESFRKRASELNAMNKGDQVAYFLSPVFSSAG
jgi:SAM-dependent methyltransferase